jgi:hypothetical protein
MSECDVRLRGKLAVVTVLLELLLGHKLGNRHLALGIIVNLPGTPKSLHLPVAALNSCRIVYHGQSMSRRHILIDFPKLHDSHPLHMIVSGDQPSHNAHIRHCLTVRERT